MVPNKEQLITNILANYDYIKQLLNENILHAAPISTLIEITVLLEETWNRVMEIGEVEDEEEQDWDYNIRMRVCLKPPFLKHWLILHQLQNTAFFCVIFQSFSKFLE